MWQDAIRFAQRYNQWCDNDRNCKFKMQKYDT